MLELRKDKKEHKVRIEEEVLVLREPSYKESRVYSAKLKDLDEDAQGDALLDFLEGLGLPRKHSEDLTASEIQQVCELLMPTKKK